jgi:hypothetical protein
MFEAQSAFGCQKQSKIRVRKMISWMGIDFAAHAPGAGHEIFGE